MSHEQLTELILKLQREVSELRQRIRDMETGNGGKRT